MSNAKVQIRAEMSTERLQAFLQNLRDFDMAHNAEIPFEVVVDCPDMRDHEVAEIFAGIKPPLPYGGKFTFADGKWTPMDRRVNGCC